MHATRWVLTVSLWIWLSGVVGNAHDLAQPAPMRIGQARIQSAAWFPDGERILIGTALDAQIYTADLRRVGLIPGAQLATLSPDGASIAGTLDGRKIQLWNDALQPVRAMATGLWRLRKLTWSPDGRYLIYTGQVSPDRLAHEDAYWVWDLQSDAYSDLSALAGSGGDFHWSPDGRYVARHQMGDFESTLKVFDTQQSTIIFSQSVPQFSVQQIIWRNAEQFITVTFGEGTYVTSWDLVTGTRSETVPLCSGGGLAYSRDAQQLYAGCYGSLRVFDADTFALVKEIPLPGRPVVIGIVPHPDGRIWALRTSLLGSPVLTAFLRLDSSTGRALVSEALHRGGVVQVVWHPAGDRALTVGANHSIAIVALEDGGVLARTDAHSTSNGVAAWKDDSALLAVADTRDSINLWDAATGELHATYGGHGQPVTELDWQPGGALLAARGGGEFSSADTSVRIWDTALVPDEALRHRFRLTQPWPPQDMAWDPDGDSLAVAYCMPAFTIWPIRSFGPPKQYTYRETSDLCPLYFSRTGDRLAVKYRYSGGGEGLLTYDVASGAIQVERFGKVGAFWLWTPEDRLMLMRFYSDVYRPPLSAEPEVTIEGYPQFQRILPGLTDLPVIGTLSASGKYAAAATDTGAGLAWEIETGAPLFMLGDAVNLAWSPREDALAVGRSDSRVWILGIDGRIIQRLPPVRRVLSPYLYDVRPDAKLVWSPDGRTLAHLHDGVIDLWRLDD